MWPVPSSDMGSLNCRILISDLMSTRQMIHSSSNRSPHPALWSSYIFGRAPLCRTCCLRVRSGGSSSPRVYNHHLHVRSFETRCALASSSFIRHQREKNEFLAKNRNFTCSRRHREPHFSLATALSSIFRACIEACFDCNILLYRSTYSHQSRAFQHGWMDILIGPKIQFTPW